MISLSLNHQSSNRKAFSQLLGVDERNFEMAMKTRTQLCEIMKGDKFRSGGGNRVVDKRVKQQTMLKKDGLSLTDEGASRVRLCLARGLFYNMALRHDKVNDANSIDAAVTYVNGREALQLHPSSTFCFLQQKRPRWAGY